MFTLFDKQENKQISFSWPSKDVFFVFGRIFKYKNRYDIISIDGLSYKEWWKKNGLKKTE